MDDSDPFGAMELGADDFMSTYAAIPVAKKIGNFFSAISTVHTECQDTSDWIRTAMGEMDLDGAMFCQIVRLKTNEDVLFIVHSVGEIVQVSAAAIASGIPWTASVEENFTVEKRTLLEASTETDQASSNSRWTISDKLKNTILAIPFTQKRTLRIADDAFLSEMVPLINVKYVDVGTATGTTKEVVVGYTGLINLVCGLCARIDEMKMSNTRQVEVLSKRIDELAKKMEDLTGILDLLSEETIRRKLVDSGEHW
jgi:hypothetical protein